MAQTRNQAFTLEVEAGELNLRLSQLYNEYEAHLEYMRPCLKDRQTERDEEGWR